MLKKTISLGALAIALIGFASTGLADGKEGDEASLKGIKCLFCKMDVSKEATLEYKGATLYFGCAACPSQFDKDNAKHVVKANAQLVATKQAKQKACPLSGKPCSKDYTLTLGKAEVAFCCANCKGATEKLEGDAQLAKVFNEDAFKKAFVIEKKN